jgi:hypothetical protein
VTRQDVRAGKVVEFSNGSGVLETDDGELVPLVAEGKTLREGEIALVTLEDEDGVKTASLLES